MRNTNKYAAGGLAIGALVKAVGNAMDQQKRMQNIPGTSFDWGELMAEAGRGAILCGLIGTAIGAYRDYQNSMEKPLNTDALLNRTLFKVKLDPRNRDYIILREKGNEIVKLLKQRFCSLLRGEPIFMGSTERGTAVRRKFDVDIGLLFRHDSFYSTADMYNAVYSYARSLLGSHDVVEVREQKKSIGLIFRVRNKDLKIDIVPCKMTKGKRRGKSGYLSINESSFWGSRSTIRKQTSIYLTSKS